MNCLPDSLSLPERERARTACRRHWLQRVFATYSIAVSDCC